MYQKSLIPSIPFPPMNVVSGLLDRPDQKEWPDYTVHIDAITGVTRSFKQFRDRVSLAATALGAPNGLGLSPERNDMVGILSDNCLDYYTVVYALLAITTPISFLPSHSKHFELVHLFKLSKITWLFVQPKFLAIARLAAHEIGLPEERIFLLEGHSDGKTSLDDLVRKVQTSKTPLVGVRPAGTNTLAYLIFSSGTTGLPKAVMTSHGNVLFTFFNLVRLVQTYMANTPPLKYSTKEGIPMSFIFIPLYHAYGLFSSVFTSFAAPATQLVLPRWDLEQVLTLVPKYRVTHMSSIPSAIHQLVNHPKFDSTDWSSVVSGTSGAAHLPPDLGLRYSKRIGLKRMAHGYGLSEATVTVTFLPSNEAIAGLSIPPNSVGILLPGTEARIVRDDGTDAGPGEPGELWVRGGNVTLGYYNDDKATKEVFLPDGWLRTGDTLKTDGKGVYFFEDRAKDTLKVSGSQVSPTEIEIAIRAHPDKLVTDVTVAGVTGGRTSDERIPRAWVVLSEAGRQLGEASTIEALQAWTRENLTKFKWLRGGIEVVDEIPKSPTGKVLKRVLQDRYEARLRESKARL